MNRKTSELVVITKAKDLCTYIMLVTQKSPKQFRFTFTSRIQNLMLDIIEKIYRANDVYVSKDNLETQKERLTFTKSCFNRFKTINIFFITCL